MLKPESFNPNTNHVIQEYIIPIIRRNLEDNLVLNDIAYALETGMPPEKLVNLFLKRRDLPSTSLEEIHLVTLWMNSIRERDKEKEKQV